MKKRLAALILTAVILASSLIIPSVAYEELLRDEFATRYDPTVWILAGTEFKYRGDLACIEGYNNAVVIQSNYIQLRNKRWWSSATESIDVQILACDYDEGIDKPQTVSLWYRDGMQEENGHSGPVYMFTFDVTNMTAYITKEAEFEFFNESGLKQQAKIDVMVAKETPVPEEVRPVVNADEDSDWFTMSIRVTEGKIEGFIGSTLVASAETDDTDEYYTSKDGYRINKNTVDATVGTQMSAFVALQKGNYLRFDNFVVYSPDFIPSENTKLPGDANSDGKINLSDVTAMLKSIAKWDIVIDTSAADVNGDGNVNLADVTTVLKFIAGWDVVLK